MNRDEIKAEWDKFLTFSHPDVKAIDFAEHIAKLVREECAVLCENLVIKFACSSDRTLDQCAGAIRARGNE